MSNNAKNTTGGGMGFTTVLFLIFLVLKLTGNIDWSWVWVTSPIWIPMAVSILAVMIMLPFLQRGTIPTRILAEIALLAILGIIAVIVLVIGGVLGVMSLIVIGLPLLIAATVLAVVCLPRM